MSELFWDTVTEEMKFVLNGFSQSEIGQSFYLAGDTAFALQIGHRRSDDLDFFSQGADVFGIRPQIEEALLFLDQNARMTDSFSGNLVYLVRDLRICFDRHDKQLVAPLLEKESLRLASMQDIALMKLDALLGRASRKDFYDLYFVCQQIPLKQLLELAPQKYPAVRDFEAQVVKRLVFFESADDEIDPPLSEPVAWQDVKDYLTLQAEEIGQS